MEKPRISCCRFLENSNFEKFTNSEMPEYVYYEIPEFLLTSIKRNFKSDWKNVALSLNKEAFFDIRVNKLKNKNIGKKHGTKT